MESINLAAEERERKACRRIGTDKPICLCCWETSPHCMEKHHVGGQRFHPFTILVCCNCHKKLTNMQKDHPKMLPEEPSQLEIIARFLMGLADLFSMLIKQLRQFADYLYGLANSSQHPIVGTQA